MTFDEALDKIYSLLRFGSRPGLERLKILLDALGNPQKDMKFVHVAGTNGKGSVCTMISSVLRQSGYKTGLFLSPYVLEFCERIQVDGCLIPKDELAKLVEETFPLVEKLNTDGTVITEFEYLTALAFLWFKQQACDIVVLEVGLGGRFDATNVIDCPLVAVIASISLDHTRILGDTIEKIAFEKSGIIKKGCSLVFYRQQQCVNDIFEKRANQLDCKIIYADELAVKPLNKELENSFLLDDKEYSLGLIGNHQIMNASLAISVLRELNKNGFDITENAMRIGLKSAFIPARFEIISRTPTVILDGAHNPDGMQKLSEAIKSNVNNNKKICILGMLADKNIADAIIYLNGIFDTIICTTPDSPRAMSATDIAELVKKYCGSSNIIIEPENEKAVQTAACKATQNDALVVCGSLYLASSVRPLLFTQFDSNHRY